MANLPLQKGELVLVDSPLALARSHDALIEELSSRSGQEDDFRRVLLSFCGAESHANSDRTASQDATSPQDRVPVPASIIRSVVSRNYHAIDAPPKDGEMPSDSPACGLFPLASLVNHSLNPNATRFFAGQAACYRLLRDLQPGDEVLDNYLNPCLSYHKRLEMLCTNHDMEDEGPDGCDAPPELITAAQKAMQEAEELMGASKIEDAFRLLADATSKASVCPKKDPALTDVYKAFADVAGCLKGGVSMQLEGLAMAFDMVTARERYSVASCALAAELLGVALSLSDEELPADQRDLALKTAQAHVRHVYGDDPDIFKILNPGLSAQCAARGSRAAEPPQPQDATDELPPESKRAKLSTEATEAK